MNAVKLRRTEDPTPAEIVARAAEIRRGWSPEERERRSSGRYAAWEIPVCSTEALKGVGGHAVRL